jgi:hypothetical protein
MRAVLIGANHPTGFTDVPAALDAVYVASEFLTYRFGSAGALASPSWMVSLTKKKATKDAVAKALKKAKKQSDPGDLFVLLFSGHGGNPQTEQFFQLHDDTFTDSELAAAVNAFDTGVEVVVIADCCHAAKMFTPGPISGHPPPLPPDPAQLRLRLTDWLTRRSNNLLSKVAETASFVLGASSSGIQVHVNGQSEFVRTLTEAVPDADRYKDLLGAMKALVPTPEEQANWSVAGRPVAILDNKTLKKS